MSHVLKTYKSLYLNNVLAQYRRRSKSLNYHNDLSVVQYHDPTEWIEFRMETVGKTLAIVQADEQRCVSVVIHSRRPGDRGRILCEVEGLLVPDAEQVIEKLQETQLTASFFCHDASDAALVAQITKFWRAASYRVVGQVDA